MPVPFEWNFSPAGDAAIAAKPMQNGAAVKANSGAIKGAIGGYPGKSAPDELADGRNCTAPARSRPPNAIQGAARSPRMKRAIGIVQSHRGGAQMTCAPRPLPLFPDTPDPKSGLNFAAFCQASFFAQAFFREDADTRCERSHFDRQPP